MNEFEAQGGEVVAIEQYAGADVKDFNAQLINIAAKDPEVLFLPNQVGNFPFRYSRLVLWELPPRFWAEIPGI